MFNDLHLFFCPFSSQIKCYIPYWQSPLVHTFMRTKKRTDDFNVKYSALFMGRAFGCPQWLNSFSNSKRIDFLSTCFPA